MVYKKYIKRNGKVYGPYIYHSRRVNGKVVSEYHGSTPKKSFNLKPVFIFGGAIIFLALLFFVFTSLDKNLSGQVVSIDLDADYSEGESLNGILKLSLREGELLPSSSILTFNSSNQSYEYSLGDFIEDEISKGDFYIEGKNFSGNGEGYGTPGKKVSYPNVYFTLNILEEKSTSEEKEKETKTKDTKENVEEIETVSKNETPESNESNSVDNSSINEGSEDQNTQDESEIIESNEVEEISDFSEQEAEQEEPIDSPEEPVEEETQVEEVAPEETESASITGNFVKNLFGGIANFFLSLTGTGQVSLEISEEIEGQTSVENSFKYNLDEGQTVELVSGSVYTENSTLDDNALEVFVQNGSVIVITSYSEIESGFGEDFLGEDYNEFLINISSLDMLFDKGNLSVELSYANEEILSLTTFLNEGEVSVNKTVEISEINQSSNLTRINETVSNVSEIVLEPLSESEKKVLFDNFANSSIEVTRAEIFKERKIVGYELGDYKIEFSYDSALPEDILNLQIEEDKIKWLRSIILELSQNSSSSSEIENFSKKDISLEDF